MSYQHCVCWAENLGELLEVTAGLVNKRRDQFTNLPGAVKKISLGQVEGTRVAGPCPSRWWANLATGWPVESRVKINITRASISSRIPLQIPLAILKTYHALQPPHKCLFGIPRWGTAHRQQKKIYKYSQVQNHRRARKIPAIQSRAGLHIVKFLLWPLHGVPANLN